jgi:hypothetical protein
MQLVMNGLDGGTRVETNYSRQTYGQFQVRGQVPCAEGVISAFYVSDCTTVTHVEHVLQGVRLYLQLSDCKQQTAAAVACD